MVLKKVKTSRDGIDYINALLHEKDRVVTRATFWKIPHHSQPDEISLKIGRYTKRDGFNPETLECTKPKSELTLKGNEFDELVEFISENHAPFKEGAKSYFTVDENFDAHLAGELTKVFDHSNKQALLEFLKQFQIMPAHVLRALQYQQRITAVEEFEAQLQENLTEYDWQTWFTANRWALGADYVRILDERAIDTQHIADYLMEAYDGFLDIVEIKRPEGELKFWAATEDHGNIVPHQSLVKAITQAINYIYEIEREMNSDKFLARIGRIPVVKPRIVLIYGRSNDWTDAQKKAYRILNTSYQCLTIMTYDHVLDRARRVVGLDEIAKVENQEAALAPVITYDSEIRPEDLPF